MEALADAQRFDALLIAAQSYLASGADACRTLALERREAETPARRHG